MPGCQRENLQKIFSVFVYDGGEERQKAEQIKERKKPKEQEVNLPSVALERNLQVKDLGLRGRSPDTRFELRPGHRERGMGGNTGKECYYCENLGHIKQ